MRKLIAVFSFLGVLAIPAVSQAALLPAVPIDDAATVTDGGLQIKPYVIVYTGDGTGALGGAHRGHSGNRFEREFGRLHWSDWTAQGAHGLGVDWIDYCENSCAASPHHPYPVKVEAYRPEMLHGRLVFSQLKVTYTRGRPEFNKHLFPRTYTLKVIFESHEFSWTEER